MEIETTIGAAEAGEILGTSASGVRQLLNRQRTGFGSRTWGLPFPEPVKTVGGASLWSRHEIIRWNFHRDSAEAANAIESLIVKLIDGDLVETIAGNAIVGAVGSLELPDPFDSGDGANYWTSVAAAHGVNW